MVAERRSESHDPMPMGARTQIGTRSRVATLSQFGAARLPAPADQGNSAFAKVLPPPLFHHSSCSLQSFPRRLRRLSALLLRPLSLPPSLQRPGAPVGTRRCRQVLTAASHRYVAIARRPSVPIARTDLPAANAGPTAPTPSPPALPLPSSIERRRARSKRAGRSLSTRTRPRPATRLRPTRLH